MPSEYIWSQIFWVPSRQARWDNNDYDWKPVPALCLPLGCSKTFWLWVSCQETIVDFDLFPYKPFHEYVHLVKIFYSSFWDCGQISAYIYMKIRNSQYMITFSHKNCLLSWHKSKNRQVFHMKMYNHLRPRNPVVDGQTLHLDERVTREQTPTDGSEE